MFGTLVLDNEPWLGTIVAFEDLARSEVMTVDMNEVDRLGRLQRSSEFIWFFVLNPCPPPKKTTALSKEKPYALESWMNYMPSCHLVCLLACPCFIPSCYNLRNRLACELCGENHVDFRTCFSLFSCCRCFPLWSAWAVRTVRVWKGSL